MSRQIRRSEARNEGKSSDGVVRVRFIPRSERSRHNKRLRQAIKDALDNPEETAAEIVAAGASKSK